MGEFDATIAAADYRDTEITQEHASQKNRSGSQLSRDQKKRENTWEQRKNRVGWVPVKPGPKQKRKSTCEQRKKGVGESQLSRDQNKKKEHMRAEKEGDGWVPVEPELKHYKQGTHEMQ